MLEPCKHGCNKKKENALTICQHKAAGFGLPSDNEGANGRWQTPLDPNRMDRSVADWEEVTSDNLNALAVKMKQFGLEDWETEVLLSHDVVGMSFAEIQEAGQYLNVSAVLSIYAKGCEKAKRGYAALEKKVLKYA